MAYKIVSQHPMFFGSTAVAASGTFATLLSLIS